MPKICKKDVGVEGSISLICFSIVQNSVTGWTAPTGARGRKFTKVLKSALPRPRRNSGFGPVGARSTWSVRIPTCSRITATTKTRPPLQRSFSKYYSLVNIATHIVRLQYHLRRLAADAQRRLEGRHSLGTGRFHAALQST